MQSPLIGWSRVAYLAGIVLALVLLVPAPWFPLQLGKVAAFALCLAASAVLFAAGGGMRSLVRARGFYAALAVALLPLVYVLSAAFSIDPSLAWTGNAIDTDTIAFTSIGFLAFMLAFAHFRTLRTLKLFLVVLSGALAIAALFQLVSIVFGAPIPGVGDRSVNLVGKWNDLGLLVGLLGVLILCQLELGPASARLRAAGIAGLVVLGTLLAFINFPVVWWMVLVAAAAVALISYLAARENRAPVLSLAAGGVAALGLLFGATFNTALTSLFPVSSLEVRPSAGTTLEITGKAYGGSVGRLVVGTGPNTFSRQWLMHKPSEVNQSQFWSLDFNVGFSTLMTVLLSVGILGVLAWLIPLVLVLCGAVRAARNSVLRTDDRAAAVCVALAAIFSYAALALYVPSQNIILLGLVLAGAAFGFLWRQGQSAEPEASPSRIARAAVLVAIVAMVALSAWTAASSARRFVSVAHSTAGELALANGDAQAALASAASAAVAEETPASLRLATNAGGLRLAQLAQATTSTPALQAEFTATLQEALARGGRAIERAPGDYRGYLSLASLYTLLASLGVDGAYDSAIGAYRMSAERNPTGPAIPLAMARLEARQGNAQAVEEHLTRALTLKQNYTDAMLLAVELAVARNDLPAALQASAAAAQSAPGVASIWFQLGLLHYAGGDTASAIAPLERAVVLVPDYANAKYFLGISYYAEGRVPEAIALFEDLQRTNPQVQEVAVVLGNMRAGKPAFDGIQPPTEQAPVAE